MPRVFLRYPCALDQRVRPCDDFRRSRTPHAGNCDFLLKNFDLRREARSNEIDAMQKAKAVLGGADYSFVQVARSIEL